MHDMAIDAEPEEFISGCEGRGIKRKIADDHDRADSPSFATLTPVTGSRSTTPNPTPSEQDLDLYSDGHSDYDWVRLPKTREYDLFKLPRRQSPAARDSAELPLVVRRESDGKDVTMWAKMDTGADCNAINLSTIAAIFGAKNTDKHLRTLTLADQGDFGLVGNNKFRATHYTVVSFHAGRANRFFDHVRFIVIPDSWQNPNGDGVPNVILGWPFLKEKSMVMIDLDYHLDADPELEVVAERAEMEKEGSRGLMPLMLTQTKGFTGSRPPPKFTAMGGPQVKGVPGSGPKRPR